MDQILPGLLGGSVLPLIVLAIFIFARSKAIRSGVATLTATAIGWTLLGITLISTGMTYLTESLGHLDCGDNCSDSVITYANINLTCWILLLIWGSVSVWAILEARRIRRKASVANVQSVATPTPTFETSQSGEVRIYRRVIIGIDIFLGVITVPVVLLASILGVWIFVLLALIPFVDAVLLGNLRAKALLLYVITSRIIIIVSLLFIIGALSSFTNPAALFVILLWVPVNLIYTIRLVRESRMINPTIVPPPA